MTDIKQIKQALELVLNLSQSLNQGTVPPKDLKQIKELIKKIELSLESSVESVKIRNVVDNYLKRNRVQLPQKRYEQLLVIYEDLTVALKIKFLSVKQDSSSICFLLNYQGDTSAALFLSGYGWRIGSVDPNEGMLRGKWQDFDLMGQLADNHPDLDLDDY